MMTKQNSFNSRSILSVDGRTYSIYRLNALSDQKVGHVDRLPFSLKILLENLLRHEDGIQVTKDDIRHLAEWNPRPSAGHDISFRPARVILQDFTGVPCIVDLASLRDSMAKLGGNPDRINPQLPVDLVIDHSVQVDLFGGVDSFSKNVSLDYQRNRERYSFLKWGQTAFKNFRVVPPGMGIVHQVNLEYLGQVVTVDPDTQTLIPDTLIGTDSHTTMINGLGILGWGVGGIEAEAAMLGQPVTMLVPEVIGCRLHGRLQEGVTATDLVLTVTQILRHKNVVGKFVEFFGQGLSSLSLPDRATLANMAPEYGATMGFFPVDEETLNYLRATGRDPHLISAVRAYTQEQGLFRTDQTPDPLFSDTIELDLGTVEPCVAGPKRPQDRVSLPEAKKSFLEALPTLRKKSAPSAHPAQTGSDPHTLSDGSVVIAAITSCTNTSNPTVLIEAGLLAKKAVDMGLSTPPWVKTSLAPGSKVVMDYLRDAGLGPPLEKLGFFLVGYGCTTCIGNSGPLPPEVEKGIREKEWVVASVLSGNRNFEGRIHPLVRANYLMSPPLVVAYALAGRIDVDLTRDPIGIGRNGRAVYLKDIWPTREDVHRLVAQSVREELFRKEYKLIFDGDQNWSSIPVPTGSLYAWDRSSTYIRRASFLETIPAEPEKITGIKGARLLAVLGDSVTTDHISPAGSISEISPAGQYLLAHGVKKADFNSYGARRGNHEVMIRGTLANVRLKNQLAPGTEGGFTTQFPENKVVSIYDAAVQYGAQKTPLLIVAGKEYGSGSSRDWAAKGVKLLGVRAVIAESFERIHRSNLIMMGVLPLQFMNGENAASWGLTGDEVFDIVGFERTMEPRQKITVRVHGSQGVRDHLVMSRVDTSTETEYLRHGGILPFVLRQILKTG